MSGTELKVRRIQAHLKAKDVAKVAGWTSSKISRVENRERVDPLDAAMYVAALATLTTNATRTSAA